MVVNKNRMRNPLTSNLKQQKGVVLIVSLVFLVALTAVASALMQNTTTDMKMSGASQEKVIATQEAISAVDEIIFQQVTAGAVNDFAASSASFNGVARDMMGDLAVTNKDNDFSAAALSVVLNQYKLNPGCPRMKPASSFGDCNRLRIQVTRQYGRNKTSTVNVNTGIIQRLTH